MQSHAEVEAGMHAKYSSARDVGLYKKNGGIRSPSWSFHEAMLTSWEVNLVRLLLRCCKSDITPFGSNLSLFIAFSWRRIPSQCQFSEAWQLLRHFSDNFEGFVVVCHFEVLIIGLQQRLWKGCFHQIGSFWCTFPSGGLLWHHRFSHVVPQLIHIRSPGPKAV